MVCTKSLGCSFPAADCGCHTKIRNASPGSAHNEKYQRGKLRYFNHVEQNLSQWAWACLTQYGFQRFGITIAIHGCWVSSSNPYTQKMLNDGILSQCGTNCIWLVSNTLFILL